jgi:hypothetical protein
MKFVRFGSLTPQKQVQYVEPKPDIWSSSPPCKKGFFAFPAGYMDPFYLPLNIPPENRYSLLQYLRDENGNKVTRSEMYEDPSDYINSPLTAKGEAILKKYRLKTKQVMWVEREAWVMIYPDPEEDLTYYGLNTEFEDRSKLNQPLKFLLGPSNEKISAIWYLYDFPRTPDIYEGYYTPPTMEEIEADEKLYYPDGSTIKFGNWLKKNNIDIRTLCIWPCHDNPYVFSYAAKLKKYLVFEYNGALWHHLGEHLKRSEILDQFSNTWYYTDIHAYERALRKASGRKFGKKMEYQRKMKNPGYFGAHEYNATFDISKMYEVFFEHKIH